MSRTHLRQRAPLSVHRRSFIKAVGASLAALPFCRPIENSFAQSAGEALPLKFVGIYHPHGISAEYFAMKAWSAGTSGLPYSPTQDAPAESLW